jgi:hypothetical protein
VKSTIIENNIQSMSIENDETVALGAFLGEMVKLRNCGEAIIEMKFFGSEVVAMTNQREVVARPK